MKRKIVSHKEHSCH